MAQDELQSLDTVALIPKHPQVFEALDQEGAGLQWEPPLPWSGFQTWLPFETRETGHMPNQFHLLRIMAETPGSPLEESQHYNEGQSYPRPASVLSPPLKLDGPE